MKKGLLIIILIGLLCSCSKTNETVADGEEFSPSENTFEQKTSQFQSEFFNNDGIDEDVINGNSLEQSENSEVEDNADRIDIIVEQNNAPGQENDRFLSEYINEGNQKWLSKNGYKIDAGLFLLIDTQTSFYWDDLLGETVHNTFYLFFYDYLDFTHSSWNSFLLVESETKSGIKQLPKMLDYCIFGMTMYIHDVDGDGQEEVIIHQDVDMFGGFGQYRTMVYKITDSGLKEIFKSPNKEGFFDTGFRSRFLDGNNFQISNIYTGYSEIFDFVYYDSKEVYWDEKGQPYSRDDLGAWDDWDGSWLMVDSFYYFNPVDVDNDGIFELVCEQYTSLRGHSDYVGDAKSVLKYNTETQVFEVVFAEFELYYKYDTKYDRNITSLEDLVDPEIIEQDEFFKVYFEKPGRYYYFIYDKNGNIVTEGGSFGITPYSDYISDTILVLRDINETYGSEIYYDTETNRLSEVFNNVVFQKDDFIVCYNFYGDCYIIQHLFGTMRQVIPKDQLPYIASSWNPFADIRIEDNGTKLIVTYFFWNNITYDFGEITTIFYKRF